MSEENVDRMRQAQAAFERGDKDAWRALVHPDVEVVPIGDWPEGHIQGREYVWGLLRGRQRAMGARHLRA